jgi:hypothetical protein
MMMSEESDDDSLQCGSDGGACCMGRKYEHLFLVKSCTVCCPEGTAALCDKSPSCACGNSTATATSSPAPTVPLHYRETVHRAKHGSASIVGGGGSGIKGKSTVRSLECGHGHGGACCSGRAYKDFFPLATCTICCDQSRAALCDNNPSCTCANATSTEAPPTLTTTLTQKSEKSPVEEPARKAHGGCCTGRQYNGFLPVKSCTICCPIDTPALCDKTPACINSSSTLTVCVRWMSRLHA